MVSTPFWSKRSYGFTLIELLIVIAIILILISIALPNFMEAQVRARLTNTRACLHAYRTANEAYNTDFRMYVPDVDGGETIRGSGRSWASWWALNRRMSCDLVGELCSFAMLTTPIPYMKRLCFDPFLTEKGDKRISKAYALPEYTTYLSGSGSEFNPARPDTRKWWGEKYGMRYAILSRGADLDIDNGNWDTLWLYLGTHQHHITGVPTIYSATNGTYSNGDMVVSNRGHEGP
jgi:prepilin-type N-terminal cleavage/methylation domain-containing protein